MREKMNRMPIPVVIGVGILLVAGFLLTMDGVGLLLRLIPGVENWPEYGIQFLGESIAAIYAVAMMYLFGFQSTLKERGEGLVRGFYTAGVMLVFCVLGFFGQIYRCFLLREGELQPFAHIVLFVLTMVLVGITEEGVFRGVLLNLFLNRFSKTKGGILAAVLLDGVIFGVMHFSNLISGVSLKSVVVQVITAVVVGVFFAAIYLRTGNFWICVILHGWVDFNSLLQGGVFGTGDIIEEINQLSYINLISAVIFLIPSCVLLRRSKLEQLVMRANGLPVYETEKNGENVAIVSLILGIVSIMTSCIGYTMGIGIVGILAANISKKIKKEQNGMAVAGLITSIIGVFFAMISVVVLCMIYGKMNPDIINRSTF